MEEPDPSPPSPTTSTASRNSTSSQFGGPADSRTALVLIHDGDDVSDFDVDRGVFAESDLEQMNSPYDEPFELRTTIDNAPLSALTVGMYLASQSLKLGAVFLRSTGLPLALSLPPLFVLAIISLVSKQLWQMLARYQRTPDTVEIVVEAFAKGRHKEKQRAFLRYLVRFLDGLSRTLLSSLYIREAANIWKPIAAKQVVEYVIPIILVLLVLPISCAKSLSSRKARISTGAGLFCFIVWLCAIGYIQPDPSNDPIYHNRGTLWNGISAIAFAFSSCSTLPLFTSLKLATNNITRSGSISRQSSTATRVKSFTLVALAANIIVLLLLLPLLVFNAAPPASLKARAIVHVVLPDYQPTAEHFVAVLTTLTLTLGIPLLIISAPAFIYTTRLRRRSIFPFSPVAYLICVLVIALLAGGFDTFSRVLSDVTLVLVISSAFAGPALVHIVTHNFRRPLSIVASPPSRRENDSRHRSTSTIDDLLLRKERAMQRRRLGRRVVWDIAAWVILLASLAAFGAVVLRLIGRI